MKNRKITFDKLTEMSADEISDLHDRIWQIKSIMDAENELTKGNMSKLFSSFANNFTARTSITAVAIVAAVAIASKNLKITVSVKGEKE